MSAFACGPKRGGDEGVGWSRALEAARLGHQLVAVGLEELGRADGLLAELFAGARTRAGSLRWPALVGSLYDDLRRRLRRRAAPAPGHGIGRLQARHL